MNEMSRNGSGYYDPTAYAVMKIMEEEEQSERFHKVLNTIRNVCELAGFEIEGRIVLIDKTNGRTWR